MNAPVLCLNMIVKNESKIIERLIDSVAPWIGYYVVCDTGSKDDTVERIRNRLSKVGVQGEIHEIPFLNFEQARNAALEKARRSTGEFDYFLLADADMELVVEDKDFAEKLSRPAYLVKQYAGTLEYFNIRLVRRDVDASYVGRTHEYLNVADLTHLHGIRFNDYACGANRVEKLDRDIRLLKEAFQENPEDSRTLFYLAQTYKDAKLYARAIEFYERRCKIPHFPEEKWYARYQLALAYQQMEDEAKFLTESLKAYEERPSRAEPLYQLARYYRGKGQHHIAFLFAEAAAKIPYPSAESSLIHNDVYLSGVTEEISISGYYSHNAADKERAREACFSLAVNPVAHESAIKNARSNSVFYAKTAAEFFRDTTFRKLEIDLPSGYSANNPSAADIEGTLSCILRASNYRAQNGELFCNDKDNIVRTENFLLTLDETLNIETISQLEDSAIVRPTFPTHVRGYEDCRLFYLDKTRYCIATVRDANPSALCQIAILRLSESSQIEDVWIVPSPDENQNEKNWIPVVSEEKLYLIYSTDPTVVFRCDPKSRTIEKLCSKKPSVKLDHLRGGSQALWVADGWLYVAHEMVVQGNKRQYLHRFVQLNDEFEVKSISDPFVFLAPGIEFCAGLAKMSPTGPLIASFGSNEVEAYLMSVPVENVLARLKAVG